MFTASVSPIAHLEAELWALESSLRFAEDMRHEPDGEDWEEFGAEVEERMDEVWDELNWRSGPC